MKAFVFAVAIAAVAVAVSANAPGAAWGYAPSVACAHPVCTPVCKPTCKVSTTKCTNTTNTYEVCNFVCEVPEEEEPKVIVTPIPFYAVPAPAGRRLMSDKGFKLVSSSGYAPTPYVPVKYPVHEKVPVVKPPEKLPPLPVCDKSCKNVTGYTYDCKPAACTKLVEKSREEQNCTIQCVTPPAAPPTPITPVVEKVPDKGVVVVDDKGYAPTPYGRKLMDGEATYAPVEYASIPGAPAVKPGEVTPVCQQVCVVNKVTYQDVECVSDECKDEDCSGPQDCTCPPPSPPEKKEKDDKEKKEVGDWLTPIVGAIGAILGG